MKKFPSFKYPITPIIDEDTYLCFCNWVEELDDLSFEDQLEDDKKFAHQEVLTILIADYEKKTFHFSNIELTISQVIEQALEQLNLTKKDLAKLLGSNRVSEIFKGKRQLSLAQIRILHKELHIPTDILIGI
jgi:HTH-type transcriptional regulator / antitoxin HigA